MDYGVRLRALSTPPAVGLAFPTDINNQPFVTLQGNVLLPSVQTDRTVYALKDWEGNPLADIGEVPEGSAFEMDEDEFRTAIEHREVPALDLHRVSAAIGGSPRPVIGRQTESLYVFSAFHGRG